MRKGDTKWDASEVVKELTERYTGSKATIIFTSFPERGAFESPKQRGFHRLGVDGEVLELSAVSRQLSREQENAERRTLNAERFDIVLDRLVIKDEPRLSDSIRDGMERRERKSGDCNPA